MDSSNHQEPDNNRNSGKREFGEDPWRAAGLVGTVGADLAVCLGAGYYLGNRLDESQGTSYWGIIGLVAGLAVGVVTVMFLIRAFTGGNVK